MTEQTEETEERTEKQPRTDTGTDPESTQSRQKKGQMKSIFLSDSERLLWSLLKNTKNYMTRLK